MRYAVDSAAPAALVRRRMRPAFGARAFNLAESPGGDPTGLMGFIVIDFGARVMKRRLTHLTIWACLAGGCLLQGCTIDPDVQLRAFISAASDFSIFLLQNLAASVS